MDLPAEICHYSIPQAGFKYEPHLQALSCSTQYFYTFTWFFLPEKYDLPQQFQYWMIWWCVCCMPSLHYSCSHPKRTWGVTYWKYEKYENTKNNCGLCWEARTYSKALWPQNLCLLSSENALALAFVSSLICIGFVPDLSVSLLWGALSAPVDLAVGMPSHRV